MTEDVLISGLINCTLTIGCKITVFSEYFEYLFSHCSYFSCFSLMGPDRRAGLFFGGPPFSISYK